jgi:hypothetical protein
VFYAPSGSPESSLNVLGEDLIRRLLTLPINLVVKLHDRSCDPRPQYSGGVDWVARLTPLLTGPAAQLVTTANIAPFLIAADLLISDHSSAAFEYLLLDRPLVRIEIPALLREANVHPDYIGLIAECAATVRTVDETAAAVERGLAEPGQLSESRRCVASDLFYRPGSASARCALALYDAVELTPHARFLTATGDQAPCRASA